MVGAKQACGVVGSSLGVDHGAKQASAVVGSSVVEQVEQYSG